MWVSNHVHATRMPYVCEGQSQEGEGTNKHEKTNTQILFEILRNFYSERVHTGVLISAEDTRR